ncbi:MAG: 2-oxo acid dehydrogenase subunit E2 [Planctomycetales bacterium]
MSITFKLPEVGENIDKADIGNLKVAVGDVIARDQVVMEVETDKAVFELPCPHAGKVVKIHVKPGESVPVGAALLTLEEAPAAAGGNVPSPSAPAPAAAAKSPKSSIATGDVASEPEPAGLGQPFAEVNAPARPVPSTAVATAPVVSKPEAVPAEQIPPAPAGPATRRLARELGVDLYRVSGTGSGGRITPEDVQGFVRNQLAGDAPLSPQSAMGGGMVTPPLPDFTQFGTIERQTLNKVMRTGAAHLAMAWSAIPHVTQHELADVTDLEAARKRYAHSSGTRDGGPKITMTVLALKAVVTALKSYPRFNASYDAATGEVIVKKYYHIGVAVDTEQGLMVPVIRNVDAKSVVQLAAELGDLAQRARDRKLSLADMQGGSFTITNLGGIGGAYFTPIINWPEVAILGMSRTTQQMVILEGKPEIRLLLPLSLSYDHRVLNGADAARFIVKLASLLSDPFQLLSEV